MISVLTHSIPSELGPTDPQDLIQKTFVDGIDSFFVVQEIENVTLAEVKLSSS
jgi:hypothetical protein